jgi:hypothetical protein
MVPPYTFKKFSYNVEKSTKIGEIDKNCKKNHKKSLKLATNGPKEPV